MYVIIKDRRSHQLDPLLIHTRQESDSIRESYHKQYKSTCLSCKVVCGFYMRINKHVWFQMVDQPACLVLDARSTSMFGSRCWFNKHVWFQMLDQQACLVLDVGSTSMFGFRCQINKHIWFQMLDQQACLVLDAGSTSMFGSICYFKKSSYADVVA